MSSPFRPRPCPLLPKGGVWAVYSSSHIAASASRVFDLIVDTEKYPEWNSFIPRIDILSQPSGSPPGSKALAVGTGMDFTVHWGSGHKDTNSNEKVTVLQRDGKVKKICWKHDGGWTEWLMQAERVHEIEDDGKGACLYRTWETFGGPQSYLVRVLDAILLQERFDDWVRDLKAVAEGTK